VEYTTQMKTGTEAEIEYLPQNIRICKVHISHIQKYRNWIYFFNLMAGIMIIYHWSMRPIKVQILKVTL
jgi:hypothetical protein